MIETDRNVIGRFVAEDEHGERELVVTTPAEEMLGERFTLVIESDRTLTMPQVLFGILHAFLVGFVMMAKADGHEPQAVAGLAKGLKMLGVELMRIGSFRITKHLQ